MASGLRSGGLLPGQTAGHRPSAPLPLGWSAVAPSPSLGAPTCSCTESPRTGPVVATSSLTVPVVPRLRAPLGSAWSDAPQLHAPPRETCRRVDGRMDRCTGQLAGWVTRLGNLDKPEELGHPASPPAPGDLKAGSELPLPSPWPAPHFPGLLRQR